MRAQAAEADVAIIGSGISGVLVARELMRAGKRVTMLERGAPTSWEEQIEAYTDKGPPTVEGNSLGARHNDENASDGVDWRWEYVYALGGTCNHWVGVSSRFLPEDFEMRSRYGVFVDWPIAYDDLEPHYEEAERILGVAGGDNELIPGARPPLPPHSLSSQDRALAPHLPPFVEAWQARPSEAVGGRPPCCGSARCELCPINSRFSVLNGLEDVLADDRLDLRTGTVAARLVPGATGQNISRIDLIGSDGEPGELHAKNVVVAANAIESAGLLLRSEISGGPVGRYFSSRESVTLSVLTRTPLGVGTGATKSTGASYAYYTGGFRSKRSAALLLVENIGRPEPMLDGVAAGLAAGSSGQALRDEVVGRWDRTATFSVVIEDEPRPENAVTLSSDKDALGLPLNRVRYRPGEYEERTLGHLVRDVPRRLSALGATDARLLRLPTGAHLLGTLRMGEDAQTSVVDRDLRHHRLDNLYVAGGAVFPTYAATHPTLTIAALALRLGRSLAASA